MIIETVMLMNLFIILNDLICIQISRQMSISVHLIDGLRYTYNWKLSTQHCAVLIAHSTFPLFQMFPHRKNLMKHFSSSKFHFLGNFALMV